MDLETWERRTIRDGDHTWWTGAQTVDGYAKYARTYVHRWICEQVNGPIPPDHEVDHTCGVRHPTYGLCVDPAHLEPVTKVENMRRAGERVTHCRHGHLYTSENTYRQPTTGRKSCRTCRGAAMQKFLDKNPGYQADWYLRRKEG